MGKVSDSFNKKVTTEQMVKHVAPRNELDLSDLLNQPKGSNVISLDDLIPAPRKSRVAFEVVLFWTDWTCQCGKHYEMPTYGDTLTRYRLFKFGKEYATQYEHYLPACHAHLPRRVEQHHIAIQHCPTCLAEAQIHEDRQQGLFDESA